jgi:hypothetical protein
MSLDKHIAASKAAIEHVRSKMTLGASTSPEDVERARQQGIDLNQALVDQQRRVIKAYLGSNQTFPDRVAEVAEASGLGNCGEQAYCAFEFLRWNHEDLAIAVLRSILESQRWIPYLLGQPRPMDWNHQLVVIGVPKLKPGDKVTFKEEEPPLSWPDDAVICDPWLGGKGRTVIVKSSGWKIYVNLMLLQTVGKVPKSAGYFLVDTVG